MTAISELIAERLPSLVHPGDEHTGPQPLHLPMFNNASLPPEMADEFARQAGVPANVNQLFGEAIEHLITTEGQCEIVPRVELDRLRNVAASDPYARARNVKFRCTIPGCEGAFTMHVNASDPENPRANLRNLIAALSTLNPECPHGALS